MNERLQKLADNTWLTVVGRIGMISMIPLITFTITLGGMWLSTKFDNFEQRLEAVTSLQTRLDAEASARQALTAMLNRVETRVAVLESVRATDRQSFDRLAEEFREQFNRLSDQLSELNRQVSGLNALNERRTAYAVD